MHEDTVPWPVSLEELAPENLGQARDDLSTTRRYVQDLLEYMDKQGVTKREGDARKLK